MRKNEKEQENVGLSVKRYIHQRSGSGNFAAQAVPALPSVKGKLERSLSSRNYRKERDKKWPL